MQYLIEALIITIIAQFIYTFCLNLMNKIKKVKIKNKKLKYIPWKDYWLRKSMNRL
jgi:hypothetical protein